MIEILLNGRNVALIDDSDETLVKAFHWYVKNLKHKQLRYAVTYKPSSLYMHRLILGEMTQKIEHINGNGLDNRHKNLRICTTKEEDRQTPNSERRPYSNYIGVWKTPSHRWAAKISYEGKQRHIGSFKTAKLAANAYDSYAKSFHGAKAKLNFPEVSA
jgi:hypothetical protein